MTSEIPIPSFTLNTGHTFPAIGFGSWMGPRKRKLWEDEDVIRMVKDALEFGYRHIDTAAGYGTEESIGKALKESHVPRHELFITTKFRCKDHGNVEAALDTSLRKLGLAYVDLYLMHWPQAKTSDALEKPLQPNESPTFVETWAEMEKLVISGKTRAIGVANFSPKNLSILLQNVKIVPAVNQVEAHPSLPQFELLKYCSDHGIILTAYSPIARGQLAGNAVIAEIASRKNATATQVILSWGVQRGTAVIPKSARKERLHENFKFVQLEPDEIIRIDQIHKQPGKHYSVCGFHSSDLGGSVHGWTYAQMGWDGMVEGGVMMDDSE